MKKRLRYQISLLVMALVGGGLATGLTLAGFEAYASVDSQIGVKRLVYLKVELSDWNSVSAKYAAWIWGEGLAGNFANNAFMESLGSNTYRCTVPSGYSNIIFVRCNNSSVEPTWDYDAGLCWDQTADLTLSTNSYFTVTGGSAKSRTGTWSSFTSYTYSS